jgi:hypothetical protein
MTKIILLTAFNLLLIAHVYSDSVLLSAIKPANVNEQKENSEVGPGSVVVDLKPVELGAPVVENGKPSVDSIGPSWTFDSFDKPINDGYDIESSSSNDEPVIAGGPNDIDNPHNKKESSDESNEEEEKSNEEDQINNEIIKPKGKCKKHHHRHHHQHHEEESSSSEEESTENEMKSLPWLEVNPSETESSSNSIKKCLMNSLNKFKNPIYLRTLIHLIFIASSFLIIFCIVCFTLRLVRLRRYNNKNNNVINETTSESDSDVKKQPFKYVRLNTEDTQSLPDYDAAAAANIKK